MSEHVGIGELAKETGVKVVTIRYYEQVGVLEPPERTEGNYRTYSREHAKRLRFIRRCRDLGFSLDEIRGLLRLSSEDAQSCVDVCVIAGRHLEAVEEKIADLNRLASELRSISASCTGNRPMAECRIIEALSPNEMGREQIHS
jgi:Hg(II)-responsive transcriptional regulator